MYKFNKEKQAFFNMKKETEDILSTNFLKNQSCDTEIVNNGYVLPLTISNNLKSGGVCDSKFGFIAGFINDLNAKNDPNWLAYLNSYVPKSEPIKRNEVVIFGGILMDEFGHVLRDSYTRLWYIIQNSQINHKVVFLNMLGQNGLKFEQLLGAIGLKKERYEVITQPTQFNKIIVPEQSLIIMNYYKKECLIPFDTIISKIKPANFKKIYLSRSKYNRTVSFSEEYFENFYKKRGFEIIYPETLPFFEQVSIINGADEIVCTAGTLVHMTFFCKSNVKVTILGRTYNSFEHKAFRSWLFSLQIRKIEAYFVDVSNNFLPAEFSNSIFFYGPTKYWIDYLNTNNIPYEPDEVSFDIHVKPHIYDYLIEWSKHNSNLNNYNWIRNNTLFDVVKTIQRTFLDTEIKTKQIPERDDIVKMQHYIKHLQSNINTINETKQVDSATPIQQNLEKLATQTQSNFKNAQNAMTDLNNKINIQNQNMHILNEKQKKLEQYVVLLEKRISDLESK